MYNVEHSFSFRKSDEVMNGTFSRFGYQMDVCGELAFSESTSCIISECRWIFLRSAPPPEAPGHLEGEQLIHYTTQ